MRITGQWFAPVSGIYLAGCGLYALIGFPLDDVWHRLFGQDVTLWGPTHLMLIGGAGLATIASAILASVGLRARGIEEHVPDDGPALLVCNHVSYMDALLISATVPRPIRFVMYWKIFRTPGFGWVFRAAKARP